MTIGMMDDKPTSQLPAAITVVRQAETGENSKTEKKSRVNRKHVIIGVTCAVVTAIVITGVLVGVKFFLDSTNDIVKETYEFSLKDGEKVTEDVDVSVKGNFVQYHLERNDTEIWVLNDFNKDLQSMKVKTIREGVICYVTKLNRSNTDLPKALLDVKGTDETLETEHEQYELSYEPVDDKSVLGTHGQKLCENIDAHWLTAVKHESTNERQKRSYTGWYTAEYCYETWKCRGSWFWRKCRWERECKWIRKHCSRNLLCTWW